MTDTIIVYIAGKEMARGQVTSYGQVSYNQQTYLSVIDFYTDSIQRIYNSDAHDWWQLKKQHYNNCYVHTKAKYINTA